MMTKPFTLAHISDLHLTPLDGFHPRYWNVKRGLGFLNWHRGRRRVHLKGVADLLASDMLAQKPDHIAVTGDLANIGLPAEYEVALSWLRSLGGPGHVSVVPGNHDIYTARMHGASCVECWAEYMTSNAGGIEFLPQGAPRFPYVRRFGQVALIGLNSAVPQPPFIAAGLLGADQLRRLGAVLDKLGSAGLVRVVLIHHPPLPGQAPPRRGLDDAAAFARTITDHGAELVLHGHNHRDMLAWQEWSRGRVPVIGVGSGSAARQHKKEPLARYRLFRIAAASGGGPPIEMVTRGLVEPGGAVVEIDRTDLVS